MTSSLNSDAVVGIDDSVGVLRRYWKIITIATLIGLALGLAAMTQQESSYVSDSLVEVRPLISQGDSPNLDSARQVNTETEQSIAASQRVVERALALLQASEQLEIDDLDDLAVAERASEIEIEGDVARNVQNQIDVTFERNSLVLQIQATARRPGRAQALAQSVAHAYLDFRIDAATASTNDARERLVAREDELLKELDEIGEQIQVFEQNIVNNAEPYDPEEPSVTIPQVRPAELRALEVEEVAKRQNLLGIANRLANIDSISINVGEILDDAETPRNPSGLPKPVAPVAGLLAGLGLGVAAAFARNRTDQTVREPIKELKQIGSEILGFSPSSNHIAVTEGAAPTVDEAYRRTQAGLLFKMDDQASGRAQKIVLVAGTVDGASADTAAIAAANLAVAAARAGRSTLLVLADLRNQVLHERFGLANDKGLAEVLLGKEIPKDAIKPVAKLSTLSILPPGAATGEPNRLLHSPSMGRLLTNAATEYDLVVVQAPTLTDYADAVVLGPLCDTAVLVVEPNKSRREDLESSFRQLRAVGLDVSGAIVAESVTTRRRK